MSKNKEEEKNNEDRLDNFVNKDLSKNGSGGMLTIIMIIVILLIIVGAGYYYYANYYNKDPAKKMRKDTSVYGGSGEGGSSRGVSGGSGGRSGSPKLEASRSGEKLSIITDQ